MALTQSPQQTTPARLAGQGSPPSSDRVEVLTASTPAMHVRSVIVTRNNKNPHPEG